LKIEERTPVIYVPQHVRKQMLEAHRRMWSPFAQFRGSDREIVQQMLDLSLEGSKAIWSSWSGRLNLPIAVGLIELGLVSSWSDVFVFVQYHPQLHRIGPGCGSQATSREDLFERSYLAEDIEFLDVPEYPDFDPSRHEYVLCTAGSDGWTPEGELMDALRRDRLSTTDDIRGSDWQSWRALVPWHEWIDSLYVYTEDASGHPEEVATFNLATWQWEHTPGVQESVNG